MGIYSQMCKVLVRCYTQIMTKFIITDKGLEYWKALSEQRLEPLHLKGYSSVKPQFITKRGQASKLLLLNDGYKNFQDFQCGDIKKLMKNIVHRRVSQYHPEPTSCKQSPLPRQTSVQLSPDSGGHRLSVASLKFIDTISSNNKNASQHQIFINQNELKIYEDAQIKNSHRVLKEVLRLPKSTFVTERRETRYDRSSESFNRQKDYELTLKQHLQEKLNQMQAEKNLPRGSIQSVMNSMKTEERQLELLQKNFETVKARQAQRLREVHQKKYEIQWNQYHVPQNRRNIQP